jgi:hypothetical protein
MIKNSTSNGDWCIFDNKREPGGKQLVPNLAAVEGGLGTGFSFANTDGFYVATNDPRINLNNSKFIYVAIAEPVVRNLTQEEVDTTKLLFETKEFRKEKFQQDTVSRAADLRANFEARGFTTAEIDDVLGT